MEDYIALHIQATICIYFITIGPLVLMIVRPLQKLCAGIIDKSLTPAAPVTFIALFFHDFGDAFWVEPFRWVAAAFFIAFYASCVSTLLLQHSKEECNDRL